MRIWMLEPGGWGGISQSSQYLAAALRDAGEQVLFITAADVESVANLSDTDVWRLITWSRGPGLLRRTGLYRVVNILEYLRALATMYRRARRERPDILHLQGYYVPVLFWLTAVVLSRFTRATVLTCHNAFLRSDGSRGGLLARWGVRRLIARADVTVLHAADDVDRLKNSGLGTPRRCVQVPLGWHPVTPAARSPARESLGLSGGDVAVLFLGYLRADKGLDLLATALRNLDPRDRRGLRVLVAGEDRGGLDPFRALVRDYGLENVVRIRAQYLTLDEMSVLVAAADVMVLAHRQASDSGILRMAMAGGVPVVAPRAGAFAGVVSSAKNGWLFDAGDSRGLADALRSAIRTPAEARVEMGLAGRTHAERHYGWDGIASAYRQAYRAALTGG